MTIETWDADEALTRGPWDTELDGCSTIDRYGLLPDEMAGEPFAVALAQEEADTPAHAGLDDQWLLVDDEVDALFEAASDRAPEELAMHLVEL